MFVDVNGLWNNFKTRTLIRPMLLVAQKKSNATLRQWEDRWWTGIPADAMDQKSSTKSAGAVSLQIPPRLHQGLLLRQGLPLRQGLLHRLRPHQQSHANAARSVRMSPLLVKTIKQNSLDRANKHSYALLVIKHVSLKVLASIYRNPIQIATTMMSLPSVQMIKTAKLQQLQGCLRVLSSSQTVVQRRDVLVAFK